MPVTAVLLFKPTEVTLLSVVILGWLAVWIVPVTLVAEIFLILDISLLASTINALLASAIPVVVISL